MNRVSPVKLGLPGAGLPWPELMIAKVMVGWAARRTSREQAHGLFVEERATIRGIYESHPEEVLRRPVLIPRLRGLEDSSRFWSILMTLEHLRVVNIGAIQMIEDLVQGKTPGRVVSTAAVKPSPGVGMEVIGAFETSCHDYLAATEAIPNLESELKWPHPWFGPLNARRWHFFTAFHMRLHRKQMTEILRCAEA